MTYTVQIDGGLGGTGFMEAETLAEAWDNAKAWARDRNWDTSEGTIWIDVSLESEDGDEVKSGTIAIDPEEPAGSGRTGFFMIRRRTKTSARLADGPMSCAIRSMQATIRARLLALQPDQRGTLWRLVGVRETHFYAFLRGDDQQLSAANLDPICDLLDLKFGVSPCR